MLGLFLLTIVLFVSNPRKPCSLFSRHKVRKMTYLTLPTHTMYVTIAICKAVVSCLDEPMAYATLIFCWGVHSDVQPELVSKQLSCAFPRSAPTRDTIRGKQVRQSKGLQARTAFLQPPTIHVVVVIVVVMGARECLTFWHARDVGMGCVSQTASCTSGMRANSSNCFGQRCTRAPSRESARLQQHHAHSMLKVQSVVAASHPLLRGAWHAAPVDAWPSVTALPEGLPIWGNERHVLDLRVSA